MQSNRGIIQFLIIIILSVVILSLLGVSLGSLLNQKTLQENFAFLWQGAVFVWNNYAGGYILHLLELAKSAATK